MSVDANGNLVDQWVNPADIAPFVSAGHAAGKKVSIVFQDNFVGGGAGAWLNGTAPSNVDRLVANMVAFVNTHGFDGVDLDWERDTNTTQYINLITKLRAALPAGKLITMNVGEWGGLPTIVTATQSSLDQINVMCFDLDWDNYVWHNDPLLSAGTGRPSCEARLGAFSGVPKSKIGVGVPCYGRRWTGVTTPLQPGGSKQGEIRYGSLVTDPSRWQASFLKWDPTYVAEYLSIPSLNEFISFNGKRSIAEIVRWGKAQGYGGFMSFSMGKEYIPSASGDARSPLSTIMSNEVTAP